MKSSIIFRVVCICLLLTIGVSSAYAEDEYMIDPEIDKVNNQILDEVLANILEEKSIEMEPDASPMWASGTKDESDQGTHGFIAEQGVTIASSGYASIKRFFTPSRLTTLMVASIKPDIDGAATFFQDHFYLPDGSGLGGYSLSAYDNFRNHYNGAVANYNAGNYTEAVERLGKAIHFISDINQPHHATGKAALVSKHTQYEAWVEENYERFAVTSMSGITAYGNKSLLTIADDSAAVARDNIDDADSLNESRMENATNITLKRAQRDAAGVIYKFCKDTGIV